jgi:hypothetical protein
MKLITLIILALMAICIGANAIEATNGPYTISFNDTLLGKLNITMDQKDTETLGGSPLVEYHTFFYNSSPIIDDGIGDWSDQIEGISITIVNHPFGVAFDTTKPSLFTDRKINGYAGHISRLTPENSTQKMFQYFAYFELGETETIHIMSSYDWDEGTLAMLQSINITKKATR